MTRLCASPAGLTRGSIFFAKTMDCRVKPGNDAEFCDAVVLAAATVRVARDRLRTAGAWCSSGMLAARARRLRPCARVASLCQCWDALRMACGQGPTG